MTRRRRQFQNAAENLRQAELDNIAHFEPRRETVGDMLRRAREGKRLEIAAVASQSRIRSGYLKAIEEGRFQDLPGLTYAVGFVRTYADHLGLDSEDVVRRFRDEVAELKGQTQLIFPVVAAEGKIPRGAVLLLSAVLAAIAYGGWYYLSEREERPLDLIPALPAKLQELISGESATPADPAPEALPGANSDGGPAATSPAAPSDPAPAQPVTPAGEPHVDTAAPASSPAPAPAAPAPNEAPASDGAATGPVAGAAGGDVAPAVPDPATPDPATPDPATVVAPETAQPAADPAIGGATLAPAVPEASQSAAVPAAPAPADPPADPAIDPAPPSIAAPDLDASGLPTVAAPAAPSSANVPGISTASDAATLPPVAEGEVFGATEGGARIVLVARLESWIQVTDPETNALLTRVLRAGDRYYVPADADLTLATGNAGGLDVWVDGRKAPALGPVGVVRRGIALDAARLQNGTALPD